MRGRMSSDAQLLHLSLAHVAMWCEVILCCWFYQHWFRDGVPADRVFDSSIKHTNRVALSPTDHRARKLGG